MDIRPSRFILALRESFSIAASATRERINSIQLSPRVKGAFAAAVLTGGATLAAIDPVQTLGGLAIFSVLAAGRYRYNVHSRAQMALGQGVFAAHLALMNEWPAAIVAAVTSGRCTLQTTLCDQSRKSRLGVAAGGFALATGLYLNFHPVEGLFDVNNIPFIAMGMASAAEIFSKAQSHLTRLCYAGGAATQLPYHVLETGSVPGMAINAAALAILSHSIYQYDVKPRLQKVRTQSQIPDP